MISRRVGLSLVVTALAGFNLAGATATAQAPSGTATKKVTIKVKDNFFSPNSLKTPLGTKVLFEWMGDNPHSVVAKSVPEGTSKFHSDVKTSGTYSHKFGKKGKYRIECGVHGAMMFVNIKVG